MKPTELLFSVIDASQHAWLETQHTPLYLSVQFLQLMEPLQLLVSTVDAPLRVFPDSKAAVFAQQASISNQVQLFYIKWCGTNDQV
jgi:hypothetical protein